MPFHDPDRFVSQLHGSHGGFRRDVYFASPVSVRPFMFTSTTFASILPEILILSLGMLVLIVEPFWKEEQRRNVGWLTAGGLLLSMVISLLFGQPGQPTATLGGMIRFDWLGFF